jgi:voltage-dependent potassium channel beta subunit
MEYHALGRSGLKVSALSLGSWATFGDSVRDQAAVTEIVAAARDRGVNFFDMADIYAYGESERVTGKALRPYPRHTLVLASKLNRPMSDDVNDRGLSRKHIMESINKSLARIGTDYLDVYYCHRDDPETPIEETVRAMDDLIRAGKVLYWGTSEWPIAKLKEAIDVAGATLYRPCVEQSQYSLLSRARVEMELGDFLATAGISLTIWSPLASGLLTGKYDLGIPNDSRLGRLPHIRDRWYHPEQIERVRRFKRIADELGAERSTVAIAWLLRRPNVASVILGASTAGQLLINLKASDLMLPAEALASLDEIFPVENAS